MHTLISLLQTWPDSRCVEWRGGSGIGHSLSQRQTACCADGGEEGHCREYAWSNGGLVNSVISLSVIISSSLLYQFESISHLIAGSGTYKVEVFFFQPRVKWPNRKYLNQPELLPVPASKPINLASFPSVFGQPPPLHLAGWAVTS
jgi:hypothetical protein